MNNYEFDYRWIQEAKERIAPYVKETPMDKSIYLSNEKHNVFMKLECQHPVRAFKIRGAFNKLLSLSDEEKERGVAAISSGNHGVSVAYAAQVLHMKPALIIVPATTPQAKVDRIRYYGSDVKLMGNCFDDAYALGMEYIKDKNKVYVDGWDEDPYVYAGQGTAALEVLKANKDIDTILVPIGGGGFCSSTAVIAKHMNPDIKVIALYSESCPAWADSVRDQKAYHEYPSAPSVCDAMIGGIGYLSYSLRDYIDDSLEVKEEWIKKAMVHAVLKEKIVAEAAGAVPIAAMLQYGDQIPGKNIALMISGGNADNEVFLQALKDM